MMKKIAAWLLLLPMLLLLWGCSTRLEERPTVPEQFEGELEVVYDGNTFKGFMKKLNAGSCTFEVSDPPELKGLVVSVEGESVTMTYMGITYTLPSEKLPQAARVADLSSVLDHMAGVTVSSENYDAEQRMVEDSVQGISYRAYFDETGVLSKIVFNS